MEEAVSQHLAEGRAEGYGNPEVYASLLPAFLKETTEYPDEGDICLYDGLVEPVLLQEFFVLWMTHEREVGVED